MSLNKSEIEIYLFSINGEWPERQSLVATQWGRETAPALQTSLALHGLKFVFSIILYNIYIYYYTHNRLVWRFVALHNLPDIGIIQSYIPFHLIRKRRLTFPTNRNWAAWLCKIEYCSVKSSHYLCNFISLYHCSQAYFLKRHICDIWKQSRRCTSINITIIHNSWSGVFSIHIS